MEIAKTSRASGRTYSTMQLAVKLAVAGHDVCFVVPTRQHVRHAAGMYREVTGEKEVPDKLKITHMGLRGMHIAEARLEGFDGVVLFDHQVTEHLAVELHKSQRAMQDLRATIRAFKAGLQRIDE